MVTACLRGGIWMLVIFGGLLWIVPECKILYEEHELDLPPLTEMAIALHNRFVHYWFLIIPGALAILVAVEVSLLVVPKGRVKQFVQVMLWILLLGFIGFWIVSMVLPLLSVSAGAKL